MLTRVEESFLAKSSDLFSSAHQKSWIAGSASLMTIEGVSSLNSRAREAPAPPANGSAIKRSPKPFSFRRRLRSPAMVDFPPGYRSGLALFILRQFRRLRASNGKAALCATKTARYLWRWVVLRPDARTNADRLR